MNKSSNKPFYVTTPIYYVNAKPHIGHAYTTVAADCVARFKRLQGTEVFFSTGTDEHGVKIQKKAEEAGESPAAFVDEIALQFQALWKQLNISYTGFIRTTDPAHKKVVQKVLQNLYGRKIIYKGSYEGLYCVGCEQFKTADDLINGKCPDHDRAPEFVKEDAYLMQMTVLQNELITRIETDELRIAPEQYKTEMLSFLKNETLEDISISRKNVAWGIPLPFDETHTTYVWVDAFLNYLTVLGWEGDTDTLPQEWPADVQFIGKDILRVHATIWPALLMHLGLPTPQMLFTHGHILSGGKKMSKTLGNAIAIDEMFEKFGTDGTRYLLMSAGTFGDDVDLTMERMTEKYNADLANGLGNLVSRVIKLASQIESWRDFELAEQEFVSNRGFGTRTSYNSDFEEYNVSGALAFVWREIDRANKKIDEEKPWELVTSDPERFRKVMGELLERLYVISRLLDPFMPDTANKIRKALEDKKTELLFQRIK
ncbi:MAG: methionine--tRNA ligase [Candidatus Moranbacteria bacterium RIFCSPHIGHO2_01_FULL_54_31]|nr:MAG: methionine--tRNA ligase [Candidatus Moranbacteria bacterium RIFCSPHIGHO2_01_FULL_54_31]